MFHPFLEDRSVGMVGVEAGGRGPGAGENAIRFGDSGTAGIVQGYKSRFLQNADGQILPTHSISAGLDYAGVGPELAHLFEAGRIRFDSASDREALAAYQNLARSEGIIPALESAHALAYTTRTAPVLDSDSLIVVNLSGRGDKDIFIAAKALDPINWGRFLAGEVQDVKTSG
jgi:tryptophan synthase beta chain